jgi:hypothetical protein
MKVSELFEGMDNPDGLEQGRKGFQFYKKPFNVFVEHAKESDHHDKTYVLKPSKSEFRGNYYKYNFVTGKIGVGLVVGTHGDHLSGTTGGMWRSLEDSVENENVKAGKPRKVPVGLPENLAHAIEVATKHWAKSKPKSF